MSRRNIAFVGQKQVLQYLEDLHRGARAAATVNDVLLAAGQGVGETSIGRQNAAPAGRRAAIESRRPFANAFRGYAVA